MFPRLAILALLGGCALVPRARRVEADDTGFVPPAEFLDPALLQVGTFNCEWLNDETGTGIVPRNDVDYAMIGRLIAGWDLDLLALEEVNGDAALARLGLPDTYAWAVGASGWSQHVALLWRSDRVAVTGVHEVHLAGDQWPSRDLLVGEVTDLDGDLAFTFAGLHLHPYDGLDDAEERARQAGAIHDWLQRRRARRPPPGGDGGYRPVILAGDFNDTLGGINPDLAALDVLTADPDLWFSAEALDPAEDYTWIPGREIIDHVVLTDGIQPRRAGAPVVIAHDRIPPWSDYDGGIADEPTISDHRPVVLSLRR